MNTVHHFATLLLTLSFVTPLAAQSTSNETPKAVVVQTKFYAVTQKMYTDLMPSAAKKAICKELDCTERELPKRAAVHFVETWQQAFKVSEPEASKLLAGKFDDRNNRRKVDMASQFFDGVELPLPEPVKYVAAKVKSGEFKTGFELEFAARLLATVAESGRRALH